MISPIVFPITGMTCQKCVRRVQAALTPFAESASVVLHPPQATLTNVRGGLDDMQTALAEVGHYRIGQQSTAASPDKIVLNSPASATLSLTTHATTSWFITYRPLFLIIGYILLASFLVQWPTGGIHARETMRYFMAGFFLVFSFFKMLDINGFADAYAGYDLVAMRWRVWGMIYPFVELALGVAYLTAWNLQGVNIITFVVMSVSAIGVIRSVLNKQKIRCACLGSVFQLPMSTITIIEDVGMAFMAAWMLL